MQPTVGAVQPGQFKLWKEKNNRSREEQESREKLMNSVHAHSKGYDEYDFILKLPTTPKKKPKFTFDHNRNTNASQNKLGKRKYSPVVEVSKLESKSNHDKNKNGESNLALSHATENEDHFKEPLPELKPNPKRRKIKIPVDDVPYQAATVGDDHRHDEPVQAEADPVILPAYLIGFKNRGNSCYINASIQTALGLYYFVQKMTSSFEGTLESVADGSGSLLSCFVSLCKSVRIGNQADANKLIGQLKSVMETRDQQFVGNRMQDAQEFLGRCLDELSEDIISMQISRQNNLISHCFKHELLENFTCNQCGQVSEVRNCDISMWCDVSQEDTDLQQMLLTNFSSETREKRCDNCNHSEATLKTKITLLPPILIIYLKRYKYGPLTNGKVKKSVRISSTVDLSSVVYEDVKLPQIPRKSSQQHQAPSEANFPHELSVAEVNNLSEDQQLAFAILKSQQEVACATSSISTFNVNDCNDESPAEGFRRLSLLNNNVSNRGEFGQHSYKLQSVVSHQGFSATSGHYVADVCRSDVGSTPLWFRYDDDSVTATSLDEVLTGSNCYNGYILTYLYEPLSL